MDEDYDELFKILLIGDSGVGKSSIIIRYTDNTFNSGILSSIGIDFKSKKIIIKNKKVLMQIWDTAGQEKYRTMTSSYYRGAHAIVIVFDVSDYNSFEHVDKWLSDINKLAKENVIKLIVGNKSDLQERKVSFEEAKSLCKKYNIAYIETSAKDNVNTSTLFETAALEYLDVYGTPGTEGKNLNLKKKLLKKGGKNDKCC